MSIFKMNLRETIYYLSDSLNLVGNNQIDHGKRVAYIASELAKALDWELSHIDELFMVAILHDCGISKTSVYERMATLEAKNAGDHCAKGADMIKASPTLRKLSDCILHHHVDWNELKGIDLSDQTKLSANCIFLSDTIDFLVMNAQHLEPNILGCKAQIQKKIRQSKESVFYPPLVEVFLKISEPEVFWLDLEKGGDFNFAQCWMARKPEVELEFDDLKQIVKIYSLMVDAKSFYTQKHSEGVAALARYLGENAGLSESVCDRLEIAGLLHDLGKLRVADDILDKPNELTYEEKLVMQRHSYDTYDILKKINGFEDIANWAGLHHERLDGSGYPFRLQADQIPLEARIVAVADVFQSLAQNRPYRERLSSESILNLKQEQVEASLLDRDMVSKIADNLLHCWHLANPGERWQSVYNTEYGG